MASQDLSESHSFLPRQDHSLPPSRGLGSSTSSVNSLSLSTSSHRGDRSQDSFAFDEKHPSFRDVENLSDLSNAALPSPVASRKPAYRRSRLRLLLLIALALIVLFGIGAWNAPDDVRSRASELAHHVSDAASDRWNSAKEWSGWQSAADLTSSEPYSLYVLPDPPLSPQGGKEERFLSYLPHSGYHNQRSELANALSLAKMLDRTLLVPPVWIGWPSTTKPYRDLQATWDRMMEQHEHAFEDHRGDEPTQLTPQQPQDSSSNSLTAEDCKSYAKECRGTYQDTFVAWRFLTNLEVAAQRVPIVDRFNMTEAYARELSGAESDDDIYLLEDLDKYWFHFHDRDGPDVEEFQELKDAGTKYHYSVSVPKLGEESSSKKLLLIGSLFGSTRLDLQDEENAADHLFFEGSLAFRNPILDAPANHIHELMGGSEGYAGVHARVGDGYFLLFSIDYMNTTFTKLMDRMGLEPELIPKLAAKGRAEAERMKAEQEAAAAADADQNADSGASRHRPRHVKHSHSHASRHVLQSDEAAQQSSWSEGLRDQQDHDLASLSTGSDSSSTFLHKRQEMPLGPITTRADMPLAPQMVCRRELHTDPALLVLNNPVYIATDSRSPETEPALQYFWENLPCAFILSDFDRQGPQNLGDPVGELKHMQAAVNVNDGVKLGRLFLPFMEAMVAAKAAVTAGTVGSTFSSFAETILHDVYRSGQL